MASSFGILVSGKGGHLYKLYWAGCQNEKEDIKFIIGLDIGIDNNADKTISWVGAIEGVRKEPFRSGAKVDSHICVKKVGLY